MNDETSNSGVLGHIHRFWTNVKMVWWTIQVKLGIEDFLRVEDGNSVAYYPSVNQDDVLGDVGTDNNPNRLYMFSDNDNPGPGFLVSGNETTDDLLSYDFGSWKIGMDDEDEQEVIDWLVLTELHELTHWACGAQGNVPKSAGGDHSGRWNPVLKNVIGWLGENSVWSNRNSDSMVKSEERVEMIVSDVMDELLDGKIDPEDVEDEIEDRLDGVDVEYELKEDADQ